MNVNHALVGKIHLKVLSHIWMFSFRGETHLYYPFSISLAPLKDLFSNYLSINIFHCHSKTFTVMRWKPHFCPSTNMPIILYRYPLSLLTDVFWLHILPAGSSLSHMYVVPFLGMRMNIANLRLHSLRFCFPFPHTALGEKLGPFSSDFIRESVLEESVERGGCCPNTWITVQGLCQLQVLLGSQTMLCWCFICPYTQWMPFFSLLAATCLLERAVLSNDYCLSLNTGEFISSVYLIVL